MFLARFLFKVLIAQFFNILVDKKSHKKVFFKFSNVCGSILSSDCELTLNINTLTLAQQTFNCSKLAIQKLERGVSYNQV